MFPCRVIFAAILKHCLCSLLISYCSYWPHCEIVSFEGCLTLTLKAVMTILQFFKQYFDGSFNMLVSSAMNSFYTFKNILLREASPDAKRDPGRKTVKKLGEMLTDCLNDEWMGQLRGYQPFLTAWPLHMLFPLSETPFSFSSSGTLLLSSCSDISPPRSPP